LIPFIRTNGCMRLSKNNLNRKGNLDFLVPIIFGVVFIIILMVLYMLHGKLQEMNFGGGILESADLQAKIVSSRDMFDSMFLIFFFGMIFAIGTTAFLLRTQPIYLLGMWLLINVMIYLSSKMGSIVTNLMSSGFFANQAGGFTMSLYLFQHYGLIFFMLNSLIITTMYGIGRTSS